LLAGADVVIDGLRHRFLEEQGVLGEGLWQSRPDLIRCSIPGFAPEVGLSDAAAWDEVIDASLGLHRTADPDDEASPPAFNSLPIASTFAGLLAANSIVTALYARLRTGLGQAIEVPIHSSMLYGIGFQLLRTNWEGGPPPALRPETSNPLVAVYECADGRRLQLHCSRQHFIDAFIRDQGLERWRDEGLFEGLIARTNPEGAAEVQRRLRRLFATKTASEWEERLSAAGISAAVCRTVEEWLDEPHAHESGLLRQVQSRFGLMVQPGPVVQTEVADGGRLQGPRRAERGQEWTPREAHGAWGNESLTSALEGVRVLDLSMILAGPTAGRVLAEFGADVVKIDPHTIATSEAFWLDANRGKRSMQLDLKASGGLRVFERLAADTDVVIENFRAGVADRLGAGYEAVKRLRPDVVYASMNSYGHSGPFASRPGWEHLAQAVTGMLTHFARPDGQPRMSPYATSDYGTGLAASLGVLAALYERARGAGGQRITTSLASTAGLFMAPLLYSFPGHPRMEAQHAGNLGYTAWSRLYEAGDGWLYLRCEKEALGGLVGRPEFAGLQGVVFSGKRCSADSDLARQVASVIKKRPIAYWVDALQCEGVAIVPLRTAWELFEDEGLRRAGLLVTSESEDYGTVEHVGVPHRLSATPARSGRPTPAPGTDADSILREAGFSRREIVSMKRRGIVRRT
ncbi:MAG TPA: CoA transferase, partial [Dehalococcoidia bacterium]